MNTFNKCTTVNACTKMAKDLISQLDQSKASSDARAVLILNASYARQEQIRATRAKEQNAKLSSYEALVF